MFDVNKIFQNYFLTLQFKNPWCRVPFSVSLHQHNSCANAFNLCNIKNNLNDGCKDQQLQLSGVKKQSYNVVAKISMAKFKEKNLTGLKVYRDLRMQKGYRLLLQKYIFFFIQDIKTKPWVCLLCSKGVMGVERINHKNSKKHNKNLTYYGPTPSTSI